MNGFCFLCFLWLTPKNGGIFTPGGVAFTPRAFGEGLS